VYPKDREIAKKIRHQLRLPYEAVLTEQWLKEHLYESLHFTQIVCKYLSALAAQPVPEGQRLAKGVAKGLRWLPLHKAKAHHVTLDSTVLHNLIVKETVMINEDDTETTLALKRVKKSWSHYSSL
jgi:hypothetical protein